MLPTFRLMLPALCRDSPLREGATRYRRLPRRRMAHDPRGLAVRSPDRRCELHRLVPGREASRDRLSIRRDPTSRDRDRRSPLGAAARRCEADRVLARWTLARGGDPVRRDHRAASVVVGTGAASPALRERATHARTVASRRSATAKPARSGRPAIQSPPAHSKKRHLRKISRRERLHPRYGASASNNPALRSCCSGRFGNGNVLQVVGRRSSQRRRRLRRGGPEEGLLRRGIRGGRSASRRRPWPIARLARCSSRIWLLSAHSALRSLPCS